MSTGWHVTAEDIVKWAETDSRQAQETLPLLVKRLVFASVSPSLIRFPSGDSVLERGWDGVLKTDVGNVYVPAGDSAWEISTQKAVMDKANEDYSKRTENPGNIDKKTSTFVFVTSQKWQESANWLSKKKSEGQWANIRVLASGELADWLERCPAVHRWFARLIGNRPDGAWDVEQAWDAWSLSTKPPCNTDLVLAGRKEQSAQLSQLLSSKPDIISISAETKEEAYAFVLASIKTHVWLLPRLLVVGDLKEWDLLVESPHALILVPWFDNLPTLRLATQRGHWVVLPSSSAQSDKNITIALEKANREQQIKALVEMGLCDSEAQHLVHSSRGKLNIIRRHGKLAQVGQQRPDWATPENAEPLVAALLAGSWLSDNGNDCEKIAYLAGIPYDKLEQCLNKWLRTGDYPAEHLGNKWQIVSYADSWQFLSPYISESILKRFGEIAVDVLKELDPRFELPPEERWLASIRGKVTRFSVPLRHGLAKGLAILGSYGNKDCKSTGLCSIQDQVSHWIKQILIDNMSEQLWGSLASELSLLAEAAPEMFLQAVDIGLEGEKPPVMSLFIEEGPMGGCLFSGLLGGLECISWNLKYTSQAVFALGKLASNDPSGKWSNRPYNTIKEIFKGWLPQTKASLDERLKIIDSLIRYKSDLGWKLLIDLLPERGGSVSIPIHEPNFREWRNGWKKGVTWNEYRQHTAAISERILQHVSEEPETRWLAVVRNLSDMPEAYVGTAIDLLDKNLATLSAAPILKIHDELRKLVSDHRKFSSAKWALPKTYVDKLDELCQKTLPEDLVIRYKFLFDNIFPELQNPAPYSDHEENSKRSEQERVRALEEIWAKLQIFGIERLAKNVEFPGILGNSLDNTTFADQIEPTLLNWLDNENAFLVQTARAYVRARYCKRKDDWLAMLHEKYKKCWSERMWVSFCLGLPFNKTLFDFLENFEESTKEDYWKNVKRYYLSKDDETYATWVIEKLLAYKRPLAAINAAATFLHTLTKNSQINDEVLAKALEQAAYDPADIKSDDAHHMLFDFETVISEIQGRGKLNPSRLAHIEWIYMQIFHSNEIRPKVLIDEVLTNPEFFCELICIMFKANPPIEDEFSNLPPTLREQQARNAAHLLELIDKIPGQCSPTDVVLTELSNWVQQAREECTRKNRKVIGDEQIGQILSHAPIGKDGTWPHETVRDIIERCASLDLERGIEVGKSNQRGATIRALSEGGEQERKIAEEYERQAEKIKFEFPRTAGMLLRLAESYKRQATFEDRDTLV